MADHPAREEVALLARAPAVDVVESRWTLPLPERVGFAGLPLPRYGSFREAGFAVIGAAALAFAEGRVAEAEENLRAVISMGLLLGDHSPILVDNLVGLVVAREGGEALAQIFEATGRAAEARAIRQSERVAELALAAGVPTGGELEIQPLIREVTDMAESSEVLRGARWDAFALFNTVVPCMNPHKIVFGPGEDYEAWVARVGEDLVRYESEEPLYRLAETGLIGSSGEGGGWVGGLLRWTVGGGGSAENCGALFESLEPAAAAVTAGG